MVQSCAELSNHIASQLFFTLSLCWLPRRQWSEVEEVEQCFGTSAVVVFLCYSFFISSSFSFNIPGVLPKLKFVNVSLTLCARKMAVMQFSIRVMLIFLHGFQCVSSCQTSAITRLACTSSGALNPIVLNRKSVDPDPNGPDFWMEETGRVFILQSCHADLSNPTCTDQHTEDFYWLFHLLPPPPLPHPSLLSARLMVWSFFFRPSLRLFVWAAAFSRLSLSAPSAACFSRAKHFRPWRLMWRSANTNSLGVHVIPVWLGVGVSLCGWGGFTSHKKSWVFIL